MKTASVSRKDFFINGLVFSWAWHIFWIFLIVPTAHVAGAPSPVSRSAFLGAILQPEDILPRQAGSRPARAAISSGVDRARNDYFSKGQEMHKPKAAVKGLEGSKKSIPLEEARVMTRTPRRSRGLVVISIKDYSGTVGHVDFNELKRVSEREDIAAYMDFSVVMGSNGLIKDIKKRSGSGDPALDLYVMRKLKTAVFGDAFPRGERIILRFKIKE